MRVLREWDKRQIEVKIKGRRMIRRVLEEMGINPEEYVIIKNKRIVGEWEEVKDSDELVIIPVVSGG
ncbi:thiamine biosynthesis protein ThiS [Nanoarchaeota archaeon]|nr:MAG: thiamine biosynthesis protein ThiS [Nanoarchaeota archaeon]